MEIKYDSDADAMYIKLKDVKVHHTKEIEKNIIFDYGKNGDIRGIEILFVRENFPDILKKIKEKEVIA